MADDFEALLEQITEFPALVNTAIQIAPDDRLVDVLGEVNSVATRIGGMKRKAASEVQTGDHGQEWAVEQKMKGVRSYNTGGLLFNIGEQMGIASTVQLIGVLMQAKVISLKWNWSPLKQLIQTNNLDLRRATHEIEDDNPDYDYGEYWVDGPVRYLPQEREAT